MKVLNSNDHLEISSSKSLVTLITILVFFERFYVVPHMCKVSYLGLNLFRIHGGGVGWAFDLPFPTG